MRASLGVVQGAKDRQGEALHLSDSVDQGRWARAQQILLPHPPPHMAGKVVLVVSATLLVRHLTVTLRAPLCTYLPDVALTVPRHLIPLDGPP